MKNKEEIYIDKISKEEFEVLYAVGFWNLTSLDYITGISEELGVSPESVEQIIQDLEGKRLLIVLRRDEKIYSAELTENGNLLFNHPDYQEIKEELGY